MHQQALLTTQSFCLNLSSVGYSYPTAMSSSIRPPPAKRQKLDLMAAAEGFVKSSAKPKPIQSNVPSFTSAFDDQQRSAIESTFAKFRTPVVSAKVSKALKSSTAKPRSSFRPLTTPTVPLEEHKDDDDTPSYNIKRSKPTAPINDFRPTPPVHSGEKLSGRRLQTILPPPPPPRTSPITNLIPLDTPYPIHQSLSISKPASKALQAVPPPAFALSVPIRKDKEMRTISTTHIAKATDLSTERGVAELVSIFLNDGQFDRGLLSGSNSNQSKNGDSGLGLSPGKTDKGSKFLRNGLAARASSLFDRSHTSLLLWQKETERNKKARSTPSMHLAIIKVLHLPTLQSISGIQAPSVGIAICKGLFVTAYRAAYPREHLYQVIFDFSHMPPNTSSNDVIQFNEGSVAQVWGPWYEISPKEHETTVLIIGKHPSVQLFSYARVS
ncbi:hypothetical protein BDQ12DRAFT_151209 [Crucibulum laeve]|uniref:Uncharacterized protein n=1 Tax=Crucibulum laeve TaxID=68775 RepID=A0A5C3LXJ9_9AGAR|nr:hypothetical protein BDQ12DRAFT_151209 [Crucibulum laeve]